MTAALSFACRYGAMLCVLLAAVVVDGQVPPPVAPLTAPPPPTLAPLPGAPGVTTATTSSESEGEEFVDDTEDDESDDDSAVTGTSMDARKYRPITMEAYVNIFLLACFGGVCVVAMYNWESNIRKQAEVLKTNMKANLNTDKYLQQILKNFSLSHVEDHIFHGVYAKKERVSIRFKNISASIKGSKSVLPGVKATKDKTIITGVSGEFHAGHVSAILGTSGAGKTTFLNVLSGKIQARSNWNVTGNIYVNDKEADLSSLRNVMGFVPQEDIVHDKLTVRENVMFSAAMRNRAKTSRSRIRRITEDVLHVLQLEAQQNTVVGNRSTGEGLSGGQRKRVNVGIELAACPTLLFLDEPTSGLDSTGSLMLVKQLQKMTQLGMTIVMVIHQPRYGLFTLIDDVLLLGKGGRTVYIGPTNAAKKYFTGLGFTMPANENPADWMMDVVSGQHEIDNPDMRKEELPERLFEEWEKQGKNLKPVGETPMITRCKTGYTSDCEVIKSHLHAAWRTVDPSGTAALGGEDFSTVLHSCTGITPDAHVVHQIVARCNIAKNTAHKNNGRTNPARATGAANDESNLIEKRSEEVVTHKEFERYLLAVHVGGPTLQQSETLSVLPFSDVDEEEDDDESELSEVTESDMESESDTDCGVGAKPRSSSGLNRSDLHRKLPGFWRQLFMVVVHRSTVWWRRMPLRMMFLLVVEFAAIFLGGFDRFVFESPAWTPTTFMNALISVSLLTSVYSLATFGNQEELPMYWREVTHGLNRGAHFLGSCLVDAVDLFLLSFCFAATYYLVSAPLIRFHAYIIPFLFVVFVASGWGYVISCWLPYEFIALGPFVAALLCFVFGGILGLPNEMNIFLANPVYETFIGMASFTRWGVPMLFFEYISLHPQDPDTMSLRNRYTYTLTEQDYKLATLTVPNDPNFWWTGILALTFMGCLLRFLAFIGLHFTNKSKQV